MVMSIITIDRDCNNHKMVSTERGDMRKHRRVLDNSWPKLETNRKRDEDWRKAVKMEGVGGLHGRMERIIFKKTK